MARKNQKEETMAPGTEETKEPENVVLGSATPETENDAEEQTEGESVESEFFKSTEITVKVKGLFDLDTMAESTTAEFKYTICKVKAPATAATVEAALDLLRSICNYPAEFGTFAERLCSAHQSQGYQNGKDVVMASGNYITDYMKKKIVDTLSANATFEGVKRGAIWDRFIAGLKAKSKYAQTVLDGVRAQIAAENAVDVGF